MLWFVIFGIVLLGGAAGAAEEMGFIRTGTEGFYIDKTEVTVAELRAFDPGYKPPYEYFDDSNMPATGVPFVQARAYCRAQGKRLPSAEEWQMACRGPEGYSYSYGNQYDPTKARVGIKVWTEGPLAVEAFEPNSYGLYHMTGNVWEWVDDGEAEGQPSVYGGSWVDGPDQTRCGVRRFGEPEQAVVNYGFRCARSLTEADRANMAAEAEERLREAQEQVRQAAQRREAQKAAEEAAQKAEAEAKAQAALAAQEAEERAKAQAATRATAAFEKKIAGMVPVSQGAYQKFYIDRTEVTVENFRAFDPSYWPHELSSEDRMPATGVTYAQAQAYCRAQGKRLPSPEEWLQACMGVESFFFSYGPEFDPNRVRAGLPWYAGADTVGVGAAGSFGAYDMTGNVWEWVDGWYDPGQTLRSLYGGSWVEGADRAKCTGEVGAPPEVGRADAGFRCVAEDR